MKLYWCPCAGDRNFGDQLGHVLLRHYGAAPVWSAAAESDIVCVGSIAEHLPEGYEGVVAGIGVAHSHTRPDFTRADVRGVRGPITWKAAGRPGGDVVLADPGLLAPRLLPTRPVPDADLGVVAHFTDTGLVRRWRKEGRARVINVKDDPVAVIRQIASCRRIIASSLHAVIVADAFGIPSRFEPFPKVQGGGLKFEDHAAAVGVEVAPRRWREAADRHRVEVLQDQLEEMFRAVAVTADPVR